MPVTIPPLAVRQGKIPLLTMYFPHLARAHSGKNINGFSPQAMELLLTAP